MRRLPTAVSWIASTLLGLGAFAADGFELRAAEPLPGKRFEIGKAEYREKVHAVWLAQIIGVQMTLPNEHNVSSVVHLDRFPKPVSAAMVDDDWYYEMCAVEGFERHGPGLTVDQLGEIWKLRRCGTWGSSRYALEALDRGIPGSQSGLPRNNRAWWSIGPQFSCELYGALAPGNEDLAARLARRLGRINGHAEGLDGGIFAAGLVAAAFREKDPHEVVRKAAALIHPDSPYRKCLDLAIGLAEAGKTPQEVFDAVEDRWHVEYPGTNNAVANGGLLAAVVWFGEGDFSKSIDLAAGAADFSDCDNVAACAGAVAAAMHGLKTLPAGLVVQLGDRIVGEKLGHVKIEPAVDVKISELAARTAVVGERVSAADGAKILETSIAFDLKDPAPPTRERYTLADLGKEWNPDWTLERAGFGGGDGGLKGIRGLTRLEGDVLATYPRDEVRGLVLRRRAKLGSKPVLSFQAGVAPGRAWDLQVYVDNAVVLQKRLEQPDGGEKVAWSPVEVDLAPYAGREVVLRLFQRVLIPGRTAGEAYWKNLELK